MNAPLFSRRSILLGSMTLALVAAGCGNGSVNNEESARRAYFGLDQAVEKALNLGMQGFNMASSANIDPQTGMGDVMGTLVVGGQVDQGSSDNKGLRLSTDFTNYQDLLRTADDAGTIDIIYNAQSGGARTLILNLRGIPAAGSSATGTYEGTFMQTFRMSEDLMGDVTLNLTLAGQIRRNAAGGIERVPGSNTITGTAVSPYGTYNVNITR